MTTLDPRIATIVADLLAREGEYHVAGRYYANPADAAKWRTLEAERILREEHRAELKRQLLDTRFVLTEAGRAVLAQARRERALCAAMADLVDDRHCDIDRHGICVTHDQPCTHVTGRFECPVARARTLLAARPAEREVRHA